MGVMAGLLPTPSVRVPGRWQFWADMMVGGAALGNVDVASFKYTAKLSDFSTGEATLNLPCGFGNDRLLRPWSWRCWAFYQGVPMWCGVPTGITDTGAAQVTLTLTELCGYLARRQFDVNPSKVYTQAEQTTIASDLAAPLADVGVTVVAQPGSGFLRDRTYEYLESGGRSGLLTALSQVISGPEFRAEYALNPATGLPGCTLRIAYPRVGSAASGLGVSVPGAALAYQGRWDSDQMRTRTFAVGDVASNAAPGAARPVKVVDAPQSDLPRLDAADDWPGVVVNSTLVDKATTASQQQAGPSLVLTATPSEDWPSLASYGVGDDVTVNVTTPLLPGGYTVTGRLTQLDVDAAAGTAVWTVAVTSPAPRARPTLAGQLHALNVKVSGTFHTGPMSLI